MSMLNRGSSWLSTRLQSAGGVEVTYRRGNASIDTLTLVPANIKHEDYGDDLASFSVRDRDWIVWAEDLVIDSVRTEPQRGDEIDWIDSTGLKHTFRVLKRAGDRCYRHTDQTMQQIRIYSQESTTNAE